MKPFTTEGFQLLLDASLVFAEMERSGIHVDIPYCHKAINHIGRQIKRIDEELYDSDLFKLGRKSYGHKFTATDDQLRLILFDVMGLEPIMMTKGKKPSVNQESLLALGVPEVTSLIRKSKLEKTRGTYLQNFIKESVDGYMHPFFHLHTAKTYRSSSSAPNFQNIPNRDPEIMRVCRRAIIPRPGRRLACIDFSGVEVRIGTAYHKDPTMIRYNSDPSTDMHRDMAKEIYLLDDDMWKWIAESSPKSAKMIRHSGKNEFVFPEFYGSWHKKCAPNLYLSSHNETHMLPDGRRLVDHLSSKGLKNYQSFEKHMESVEQGFWKARFSIYDQWKEEWYQDYQKKGYFDTLTGYRCQGVMSKNDATNYPIQGSAFHCTLFSVIMIQKIIEENNLKSLLIGQIHDEVMIDLVEEEKDFLLYKIKEIMTTKLREFWGWINVPIDVEIEVTPIDGSWDLKKEIEI